jgi:hypothetical protein
MKLLNMAVLKRCETNEINKSIGTMRRADQNGRDSQRPTAQDGSYLVGVTR